MKLLLLTVTILIPPVALLPEIFGQGGAPFKQITVTPLRGIRGGARLAARDIERGVPYPSVVHLRGNVEIRANGFILNADQADYDENTGEVEARGTVKVMPYPALK